MRKCDYCGFPIYSKPVLLRGHVFCREQCSEDFTSEAKAEADVKQKMRKLFNSSKSHSCDNLSIFPAS